MAAKKGTRPPAAGMGRIKGSKNRLTKDMKSMVDRILEINTELDKQGKGLKDEAEKDPKWFHTNFTKVIIPKEINLDLGASASNLIERLTKALGRSSKN